MRHILQITSQNEKSDNSISVLQIGVGSVWLTKTESGQCGGGAVVSETLFFPAGVQIREIGTLVVFLKSDEYRETIMSTKLSDEYRGLGFAPQLGKIRFWETTAPPPHCPDSVFVSQTDPTPICKTEI